MTKQVTPAAIRRWGKKHDHLLTPAQVGIVARAQMSLEVGMRNKVAMRASPAMRKAVSADLQAFADLAGRIK